jgi:hypothetical protein
MDGNGQLRASDGEVLHWPGRVLSAGDLRTTLNGQRQLVLTPNAVVTPLAAEELRQRAVQVTRKAEAPAAPTWGYAQDRPHPLVASAMQAVRREGLPLKELMGNGETNSGAWVRTLAECVARGECQGGVLFCADPGLACCVANKVPGLRAVAITTVAEAGRAFLTLCPNIIAVAMPGRTFFEVRQILRVVCRPGPAICPPGVACTLRELDGHAHR